ncbi:hypothetical protein BT67DRAFT_453545 [Trichocladium antarcticum]|uniref:DUF3074 domain-containing protein n=1 Tax=Trichocladium antarcticum TaxID=1450529 RepID=A0AAN6USM3_9PEZI|nr:hypothetical protein BT67DRAFT_453545 [Trichocladium antarcticum]
MTKPSHHDPFKALSPLSWPADIAPLDQGGLATLLSATLADATLLVNSIPSPTPPSPAATATAPPPAAAAAATTTTGRARSHTDSALRPPHPPFHPTTRPAAAGTGRQRPPRAGDDDATIVRQLAREWKDLRTQPHTASNPHGIAMHKLAGRDGKGAWFARRSVHRGEPFEKWEAALRGEMGETLGRAGGGVRGLGAERRVVRVELDLGAEGGGEGVAKGMGMGKGKGGMEVYQASVRFPGPTTPRDFVTVLMMPPTTSGGGGLPGGRQFMIVSRPVEHPDCPPRPGFIRGQYESVELIREVPVERPLRRTRSSVDLRREEVKSGDGEHLGREAVLRAAKRAIEDGAESEGELARSAGGDGGDVEMAVEWLMVTRSDPGGSVPRFMVEKGTPGGVITDAGKFLRWLSSRSLDDLTARRGEGQDQQKRRSSEETEQLAATISSHDHRPNGTTEPYNEPPPASGTGIYGMITSALEAAGSAVASRVAAFAPASLVTTDSDLSDSESVSSDVSFASAEEGSLSNPHPAEPNPAADNASTQSTHSALSETASHATSQATLSRAQAQHEKELHKLQQRMHRAREKLERAAARRRAKNGNNGASNPEDNASTADKDAQALAKLREKHAREQARQQERYERELQRIADKRAAEERKAAERRRKQAERDEKADLQMELERVRAERDVARKEVEMMRERVGELQAQNTMLVARLGREGLWSREELLASKEGGARGK